MDGRMIGIDIGGTEGEPRATIVALNGSPPVIILPNGAEIVKQPGESDGWWLHRAQQAWMGYCWVGTTDGKTIPGSGV